LVENEPNQNQDPKARKPLFSSFPTGFLGVQ
jgi:hypothetical protein